MLQNICAAIEAVGLATDRRSSYPGAHCFRIMHEERQVLQQEPDWSLIDEVSVPLLENGVGAFDVLQSCLPSIVLCKANPNQQEWTQERLLKVFRIAQLQIQHILKSQLELSEKIASLEASRSRLARENRQLRQTLKNSHEVSSEYFKCEHCDKLFLTAKFLREHIERRHPPGSQMQMAVENAMAVTTAHSAVVDSSVATSVWVTQC